MSNYDATSALDHKVLANAIRALSMDAVQRANSGHTGAPLGWRCWPVTMRVFD
ncbi:hypothetical protein HKK55_16810 [Pseudomonas sp. ADAK18]|uniref:hypothetical protein n=1 Tax=Pseudomonas sp. ADAK18 TaxID=2730848 RepID=UPI001463E5A7|nr:hypothetical protein [Pseudomonas sp. ADAK18]QJI30295.1 hypothetical protein HKK55_16810 [Pseudomonas sp. ADAK18]